MDGADLLGLCGDNLVYECNLVEGIDRGELVPFAYHGIRDIVDFDPIPWRNGKFDPAVLTAAVETHERAAHAMAEWQRHRGTRTLAFCVTTTHADFMADYATANGVRAVAVHSGPTSGPRRESVHRLEQGELDVVFAVDVFNEGFDLPAIDTVLMLRPTDSPVITLHKTAGVERAGYDDRLDGPGVLVWSSQTSTGPDTKKGREILEAPAEGRRVHAWVRRRKADVAFEYRGLAIPLSHIGDRPMSVRFRLLTPLDREAMVRLQ